MVFIFIRLKLLERNIMDTILAKVLKANKEYAQKHIHRPLPNKKFAILTCMDARMDPVRFAGLDEDAYIIRNAGGRATDDAIRSLVISYKFLGTEKWLVIHHTECGMCSFDDKTVTELFEESLEPAVKTENGWKNRFHEGGSREGQFINFLSIQDMDEVVIADVSRIRNHPLVSPHIPIYGYIYDVETGLLREVVEARQEGSPMNV